MKGYKHILTIILCMLPAIQGAKAQEIDFKAWKNTPAASVYDALAGLLPWVNVIYDSAAPDARPRLTLRGEFSASGTSPLILVDDVEIPLELLDPSTIESVKVLRDGAACAIYGARASAGAIIITTRNAEPAEEVLQQAVSVAAYAGVSNSGHKGSNFNNARLTHNYNVGVSGGNNGFSYFFGGNYYGCDDLFSKEFSQGGLDKAGFSANMNAKITDWLHYSLGLDYSFRKNRSPFQGKGQPVISDSAFSDEEIHYALIRNRFAIDLAEGLRLNLSYCFSNDYTFARERSVTIDGVSEEFAPNFYSETRSRISDSDINAILDYEKTLAGIHHICATAGADIQTGMHKNVSSAVGKLVDPNLSVLTIGDGIFDVGEQKNRFLQCGIFADASYSYDSRYCAHLTFREDGSSRFSSANRWAPSAAASFTWDMSKESFFRADKDKVSGMSLRYAFSSIANQRIEPMYGYYAAINDKAGTADFLFDRRGTENFSSYSYPVSADLKAERVSTHTLGLNASFLKERLCVNVDLFAVTVENMINPEAVISAMYGSKAPLMNLGRQASFGTDILLGWKDRINDFSYGLKAMFSDHTKTATGLPDPRHSFTLMAEAAWKGLDFRVNADGVGSMGIYCLRNISAGYTIPLPKAKAIKSLRTGISARNMYFSGISYPLWIAAAVNMNF